MAREGKKRLSVDLPSVLHVKLSEISKELNIPITSLIVQMIMELIKSREPYE